MSLGSNFSRKNPRRSSRSLRTRLGCESLEGREVPASLAAIDDFTTPNTKVRYVPLTVNGANGNVTFTATSSNSAVQVAVVQGGTTIRLSVTGTGAGGVGFAGDLTFRLFDDLAPTTVDRIVDLINQGFYDDLTFHRILNGFVAQGGDPLGTGTGGSGQKIDDEFNTALTFNSPGLLAMANAGDDTGDSQFFITDTDVNLSTNPTFPQHLNFQHTIFGQLVAGFDTFTKLMSTPVNSPQVGTPLSAVTIVNAEVVQNDPNGVLRITAPSNFLGTSTISVTPTDGGGAGPAEGFVATFAVDAVNEPPFLGSVSDQTTTPGTAVSFTLTSTDLENDPVTYSIVSATANGAAVNLNPRINQSTGRVTLTPPAGFVGTVEVKVGVRDAGAVNPDTQTFTLAVAGSFDLDAASDTGPLNDDNVTGIPNPTITVFAPANSTVVVTVNGTTAGTATATATAGQYRITLPANLLKVGTNTIAGTATPAGGTATTLTAFTLTYHPSLRNVYVVPGDIGSSQQLTFQMLPSQSAFDSEIGFFRVDAADGAIGNLRPGDQGYFAAAMARRQVAFSPTAAAAGGSVNMPVAGGQLLVMYLVQGDTSANLMAKNPTNSTADPTDPVAFFGFAAASADRFSHLLVADDPASSQAIYAWEDLTGGGDRDYNDAVFSVRRQGEAALQTLRVPGGSGRTVTGTVRLQPAGRSVKGSSPTSPTTAGGEIGYILADSPSGAIGALNPGDAGWAAAALSRARTLFGQTSAINSSTTVEFEGGKSVIFYYVKNGTAAGVLSANSSNSATGSQVAFFSVDAANPDGGKVHGRYVGPEGVSRSAPTANEPYWIHMMGKANGTTNDFDDAVFTVTFGS